MDNTLLSLAQSWTIQESEQNATKELLKWIDERNRTLSVQIKKNGLSESQFWFYDSAEGCIRNRNRSFFSITGFQQELPDGQVISHPILLQQEIGYLGIICREFHGVMHLLMQAKIEPGNVNHVQISPTIQATRSNFTQRHGGKQPPYLEYFLHAERYEIVFDQLQSEQSSRFYKKRNRNLMIRVQEDVPVLPDFRWMTLGQIKQLMRRPNLVNMDTRTVLSGVPFEKINVSSQELDELRAMFSDKALFDSLFAREKNELPAVFHRLNNWKMFYDKQEKFLPLHELPDWSMTDREIVCSHTFPFRVIFADIAIEGREVSHWTQPLFEADGIALFGLFCCERNGRKEFLVHLTVEAGCFDCVEIGPTVQREASAFHAADDAVSRLFFQKLEAQDGILFDQILSEEGGRFYHEQNRNVVLSIPFSQLPSLPEDYMLLDLKTLNELVQFNNLLNIQLRNLLSVLEA